MDSQPLSWQQWLLCSTDKIFGLLYLTYLWKVSVMQAAEIGVFEGSFSQKMRHAFPLAHLYLIDPWTIYNDYLIKSAGPITHEEKILTQALSTVKKKFSNDLKTTVIQAYSHNAVELVPNELDLVYIDGNHSYSYVKQDIALWLPKLKKGGILVGDDYHPALFPGVCQAVDEYAQVQILPSGVWGMLNTFD